MQFEVGSLWMYTGKYASVFAWSSSGSPSCLEVAAPSKLVPVQPWKPLLVVDLDHQFGLVSLLYDEQVLVLNYSSFQGLLSPWTDLWEDE